jgi:hypothetical protein
MDFEIYQSQATALKEKGCRQVGSKRRIGRTARTLSQGRDRLRKMLNHAVR